jgi:hypothetical protein
MLSVECEGSPLVIPLIDVPQPPPVAVTRRPMAWVSVQSFPIFVIEQKRDDN